MAALGATYRVSQTAAMAVFAIVLVVWIHNSTWQTVNGKNYFGVALEIEDRTLYAAPPFEMVTATSRFGFLYMTGTRQGRPSTRILAPHWGFIALLTMAGGWIWLNARYAKVPRLSPQQRPFPNRPL